MFIEITEVLRCPQPHAESYIICGPVTMDGRDVVRGGLMCPACHTEYPIVDRVAWFAPPGTPVQHAAASRPTELTAEAVQAFLDLQGGGGYLLTVGNAGRLGPALARLVPNVSVIGVNPPGDVKPSSGFSVVRSPNALPIKAHSVRAVVVGADAAGPAWLEPSLAALLTGLRVVVESESVQPAGIVELMRGAGVSVGEKRAL